MMKFAAASLALILPSAALAGPVNTAWIGADAKWILHVDIEGALDSTLGRFLIENGELDDLEEIKAEMGIDPSKDIFSLTIYGQSDDENDVVAVVHTSDAIAGLLERVQEEEDYTKAKVGGHTVHTWAEGGDITYAYVQSGPAANERIAVIARNKFTLLDAIEVVKGEGANLDKVEWLSMAAKPRKGAFIYAAATDLANLADFDQAAHITKHIEQISISLGESRDGMFAAVNIKTTSEEEAKNVKRVMDGLIAMLSFMPPEDEDIQKIKKLVEGLDVNVDNANITIELEMDARDVLELMQDDINGAGLDTEEGDDEVEVVIRIEKKEAA